MAWLHTRPEKSKLKRSEIASIDAWNLPDPDPFTYLLNILIELGLTEGDQPITWQEIRAYQEVGMVPLLFWEAKLIKFLSSCYLSSAKYYEGKTELSPVEIKNRDSEQVANKVRSTLRAMKEMQNNG